MNVLLWVLLISLCLCVLFVMIIIVQYRIDNGKRKNKIGFIEYLTERVNTTNYKLHTIAINAQSSKVEKLEKENKIKKV